MLRCIGRRATVFGVAYSQGFLRAVRQVSDRNAGHLQIASALIELAAAFIDVDSAVGDFPGNLVLKSLTVNEATPAAEFKVVRSPGRTKHGRCGPFQWSGL